MPKHSFCISNQNFHGVVNKIQEWHDETFFDEGPQEFFKRLEDKVSKLREALIVPYGEDDVMDEVADCLIILCQISRSVNGKLPSAVRRRMENNLNQTWKMRADGSIKIDEDFEYERNPEPYSPPF